MLYGYKTKFLLYAALSFEKKDEYECIGKGGFNKISVIVLLVGLLAI